jgi:hypothetical protein
LDRRAVRDDPGGRQGRARRSKYHRSSNHDHAKRRRDLRVGEQGAGNH